MENEATVGLEQWIPAIVLLLQVFGLLGSIASIVSIGVFFLLLSPRDRDRIFKNFQLTRLRAAAAFIFVFALFAFGAVHLFLDFPIGISLSIFIMLGIVLILILSFISISQSREIDLLAEESGKIRACVAAFPKFVEELIPLNEHTILRKGNTDIVSVVGQGGSERVHLISALTHAANIFSDYTSDKCGVSVKQFVISREGTGLPDSIFTLQRDAASATHRRHVDLRPELEIYDWNKNSAFREIIQNNNSLRSYYLKNDLSELGDRYQNANPFWSEFYNATLVVPISASDNPHENEKFYGFLCIDNMSGGFDNKVCVDFAFSMSKLLFEVLSFEYIMNRQTNTHSQ